MKKISFFVAFACILLFTAFTTVTRQTSAAQNQKSKAGVSWHVKETFVESLTFTTCDFDQIYVPSFTTTFDFHGVINGKMTLVQGSMNFSGTGTSLLTGESYVLNYKEKLINKYPVINGATVLIHKRHYYFTGNQGSLMDIVNNTRVIINAKGEIISDGERTEIVCL